MSSQAQTDRSASDAKKIRRSVFWTGILLGIGIAAFLDETILHQLLQWHTLYWYTTPQGRLLSDGLFHIFSTLLLLWGALRLWKGRDSWNPWQRNAILAALLIGLGGFNLYDGIVQHVILRLHIVNEHVCSAVAGSQPTFLGICLNDIPYEIAFDMIALVILVAGIIWWQCVHHQIVNATMSE
ncbi:membrane protein [Dictyobacter alpinus]|uniref:Membrane protein n=1 Tax=Dictyobacter alpinus TaxID=2014873 RepID=A0A402B169_9CHLR|nr:DUF2243 domain-containing protein [Dictyobacter alpinus]GCE25089.1 membrane protein [Dictyobacter alpinus]